MQATKAEMILLILFVLNIIQIGLLSFALMGIEAAKFKSEGGILGAPQTQAAAQRQSDVVILSDAYKPYAPGDLPEQLTRESIKKVMESGAKTPMQVGSTQYVVADEGTGPPNERAYIIELTQPSVGRKNTDLVKSGQPAAKRLNELKAHKKAIAAEHQNIKNQIAGAIGRKPTFKHEFDTAANGMVAKLTPQEAGEVRSIKGVKRVTEEPIFNIILDVSVPMIGANQSWPLIDGKGAPLTGFGVKIGIIDTGVDYSHLHLGGNPDGTGCFGVGCKVEGGFDFVNGDFDPMDDHGHGTHVASTAAGREEGPGSGTGNGPLIGVAPDANIYAYKVCNSGGSCPGGPILSALDRCIDPNSDGDPSDHLGVCSMSLGGQGNPDDAFSTAVDEAVRNGVVLTISAGNSGPGSQTIGSPGTAREAITVGAACKPKDIGVS
ncbi:MAG: S8 family serine peptidase, partial [Candidatus Aenigmarchaeota archaeon]|nr:S8 family serine peptidase [Candidatus Aenigmarchaeota archaeon]